MEIKKEFKTMPIPESNKRDANLSRYGDHSDSCIVCGKRTNEKFFIHASTDWVAVNILDDDLTHYGSESQGCFPIGSDCAKKLPKEFIHELPVIQ